MDPSLNVNVRDCQCTTYLWGGSEGGFERRHGAAVVLDSPQPYNVLRNVRKGGKWDSLPTLQMTVIVFGTVLHSRKKLSHKSYNCNRIQYIEITDNVFILIHSLYTVIYRSSTEIGILSLVHFYILSCNSVISKKDLKMLRCPLVEGVKHQWRHFAPYPNPRHPFACASAVEVKITASTVPDGAGGRRCVFPSGFWIHKM